MQQCELEKVTKPIVGNNVTQLENADRNKNGYHYCWKILGPITQKKLYRIHNVFLEENAS